MAKSTVFSFIYRQLVQWFIGSVWPWVVEHIWPEIQKLLIGVFAQAVEWLRLEFSAWFNNRQKGREADAAQKAEAAEKMAETAASAADADKQLAIAQVWRQVAEDFRRENDELKAKFAALLDGAKSKFCDDLNAMDIKNVVQEGDDGTLKLPGSGTTLALPAPSNQS